MQLDEAIKTALEYEGKVHKTYVRAMEQATDAVGKRVFKVLADEEKYHLNYLRERLDEWRETGKITVAELTTSVPTKETVAASLAKLGDKVSDAPGGAQPGELELLRQALEVEAETSAFYQRMVETLDADGRLLFERFVEIEQGHQAIVQAEIDCLSGSGFWFDTPEFSLEIG